MKIPQDLCAVVKTTISYNYYVDFYKGRYGGLERVLRENELLCMVFVVVVICSFLVFIAFIGAMVKTSTIKI